MAARDARVEWRLYNRVRSLSALLDGCAQIPKNDIVKSYRIINTVCINACMSCFRTYKITKFIFQVSCINMFLYMYIKIFYNIWLSYDTLKYFMKTFPRMIRNIKNIKFSWLNYCKNISKIMCDIKVGTILPKKIWGHISIMLKIICI